MKTILTFIILFLSLTLSYAALGDSQSDCIERYGSQYVFKEDGSMLFIVDDIIIRCFFKNKICVLVAYKRINSSTFKKADLTQDERDTMISFNMGNEYKRIKIGGYIHYMNSEYPNRSAGYDMSKQVLLAYLTKEGKEYMREQGYPVDSESSVEKPSKTQVPVVYDPVAERKSIEEHKKDLADERERRAIQRQNEQTFWYWFKFVVWMLGFSVVLYLIYKLIPKKYR